MNRVMVGDAVVVVVVVVLVWVVVVLLLRLYRRQRGRDGHAWSSKPGSPARDPSTLLGTFCS